MSGPKVVYEPTVGRWRVDSRLAEDSAWSELRRFSKPGKARKYAQQMKDEMASRRVRVVDTRELKIFEPTLGRWRVDCRLIEDEDPAWRELRWFSKPGKARKYAQRWKDEGSEWDVRVVDTRPDEGDLGEDVGSIYAVEFRNTHFFSDWRTCFFTPRNASEAYEYARAYVSSLGDQTSEEGRTAYRVVRTDADGAKIAQEVTPDGLGPLNPLNRLWVEKWEREDAARVTDTAVGTSSACVYLSAEDAPLTLDQYQEQAKATAVYPDDQAMNYLVAGMAGEVGEVASVWAKYLRGDDPQRLQLQMLAELGDVLWFVAMLADELCYDLSTIAQGNLDKLADRAERGKLKGSGDNR